MSAHLRGDARRVAAACLATRYEAGATIQDLAVETRRSYSLTRALLLEAGVAMRPKGLPKGASRSAR
ncbi:transcriptional regulator [Streptomyces roseoverticillatus]|uniref:helix-turn-helix domain-containing protein n=1 Tax=Streptomyces roseoverticillatus TaxID=66429 RepID=UPI001F2B8874|nr:helix-turn-helix domain-containing protein [Streptomyces roseoverticillatus]MCF3101473.1 transcriptional regulator [Streptomyces roseoverticillatus]